MNYEDMKYLSCELPEDILREKWSGHFDNARELIKRRLEDNLPEAMRWRLLYELRNLEEFEATYTVPSDEAFGMVKKHIPDFTADEFRELHLDGKMDWTYVNGDVMYADTFCDTLMKVYPELAERDVIKGEDRGDCAEWFVKNTDDGREMKAHIHIRHEFRLEEEGVREGRTLRVHMPCPVERAQINNLKIYDAVPAPLQMPKENDHQPCAYFEVPAEKGQVFALEYSFDNILTYHDLSLSKYEEMAEFEPDGAFSRELCEDLPHIRFTPYLRELAKEIRGEERNPLIIARKIYDYITTEVTYSYVRCYASIDSIAEYCAVNRKGDCGVQALLFITLCRICRIPAQWQSGIFAQSGFIGEHDWARFYIEGIGWLYCDLSFGGSAYRKGNLDSWNFYFGNLDPYRIPLNDCFQRDFVPAKNFMRYDPYDNQTGEAEYGDEAVERRFVRYEYIEKDIHRMG